MLKADKIRITTKSTFAIAITRDVDYVMVAADTNAAGLTAMIVCSCNVFSDHDVRATLSDGETAPRTTGQVYHCLGCSARCGRCARTIRRIMDEALAAADSPCCRADGSCS